VSSKQESEARAKFEAHYEGLFDLSKTTDVWRRERYVHEAIESIWYGWRDCAASHAAEVEALRSALRQIAVERDCGCVPCRGQCTSKESLLVEADDMRAIARAALKGD
jgi:hypothetical protein